MKKTLPLGLIPIALVLTPLAALGLTYDDIGDFFRNTVNQIASGDDRTPSKQLPDLPLNEPLRNDGVVYSSFGEITQSEITALKHLKFPQSLTAMRNRFGSPSYVSGNTDWFDAPGGGYIAVRYVGERAVSVEARN